jgi:glutamate N-acetyltransferase / amino-acid N-acetyltransferase
VTSVVSVAFRAIEGGVAAPAGFRAAGVACGIKASGALDLALITADAPVPAAAVFTTNLAQAAPVILSRNHLTETGGRSRAVVINSGCANACTGTDGWNDAQAMAVRAGAAVGCDPSAVLVASTGVIGVKLDMSKVARGCRCRSAAVALRRAGRRARDHDDRSVSQRVCVRGDDGRAPVPRRRHGQGIRDDRAADGDHAGRGDDGCRR